MSPDSRSCTPASSARRPKIGQLEKLNQPWHVKMPCFVGFVDENGDLAGLVALASPAYASYQAFVTPGTAQG